MFANCSPVSNVIRHTVHSSVWFFVETFLNWIGLLFSVVLVGGIVYDIFN